jgi:hypothetical protein
MVAVKLLISHDVVGGGRSFHPGDELATVAYSLFFLAPWIWQLITWQVKRAPLPPPPGVCVNISVYYKNYNNEAWVMVSVCVKLERP